MGGARRYGWSGFTNTAEWASSLPRTPKLFAKRAGYVRDSDSQEADKAAGGVELAKVLNWFSVAMLGTGMIVGAGVFVSTGVAARDKAGPAVVLSLLIAGISALLSALCYSEFATQWPHAGGAFSYVSLTLGELAAWLVVTTLVLEYILANAAVSRSFSAYFASLIGKPTSFFTFPWGDYTVDFLAAGLMVACGLLLMFTTAGGSWFNMVITGSQLVVILLILILGFWKSNTANLTPFAPFGAAGIFDGAAFVFFSFIGFDCVSTLAEEVKDPARDMPIGIVGCISFVGIIYCLMALCLVMMVPYSQLDTDAAFAVAFGQVGLAWGQYLVALGAVLGIITGVLVGVMGVARIVTSMGRTHLFFPVFGVINPKTQTPIYATLFVTVAAVPLCILTDLPALIDMVSAGTLMVFAVVAVALMWKRVVRTHAPLSDNAKPFGLIGLLIAVCVAFACIYALTHGPSRMAGLIITGALTIGISVAMHLTCTQFDRPSYRVPFFPYLPAASLLLNCFLMASLPAKAYWQLALFFAIMIVFYLLYSVHAATRLENEMPVHVNTGAGGVPVGSKAVDVEGQVPMPAGAAAAADGTPVVRTGSLGYIDRINSAVSGDRVREAPALGRRSAGITRLPPPTL